MIRSNRKWILLSAVLIALGSSGFVIGFVQDRMAKPEQADFGPPLIATIGYGNIENSIAAVGTLASGTASSPAGAQAAEEVAPAPRTGPPPPARSRRSRIRGQVVYLPDDQIDALGRLSRQTERSKSDLVREAIATFGESWSPARVVFTRNSFVRGVPSALNTRANTPDESPGPSPPQTTT